MKCEYCGFAVEQKICENCGAPVAEFIQSIEARQPQQPYTPDVQPQQQVYQNPTDLKTVAKTTLSITFASLACLLSVISLATGNVVFFLLSLGLSIFAFVWSLQARKVSKTGATMSALVLSSVMFGIVVALFLLVLIVAFFMSFSQ